MKAIDIVKPPTTDVMENATRVLNWGESQLRLLIGKRIKVSPLTDDFWNFQLEDRKNAVVINGEHYRIGSTPYPKKGNGFTGQTYTIKLDTGEIVKTRDLWHQGIVPEEHWGLLPDNARFL